MTNSVCNSGRDSTRPPGPATDRYSDPHTWRVDESSHQALRRMRDAPVRRLPVVSGMGGHLVGAISTDDLVLLAQNVRAGADVARVVGFHAVGPVERQGRGVGSLFRFRDGVDHLFVAALVASGVRRAGIDPAPPHDRGQSPGPLCERGDQPMVVWGSRCPSKVHPVRGDQTDRHAAARAADASTPGARGPNEREVHRDPSRRTRAAELPPTSLRSATTKGTRGSKRYARSTGATRSGAAGPEYGANPGDKRLHRCRDSSGWTARPAPRGACWLERKPCGSFIRHRARKHPQAEAYLDACLDATVIAGAQRTSRCSTR